VLPDEPRRRLDLDDRDAEVTGDLVELAVSQQRPVLRDDRADQRVVDAQEREVVDLDQQALAQVARADADRLERLQRGQDRLDPRQADRQDVGDLLDRAGQVAPLVQVADQLGRDRLVLPRQDRPQVDQQPLLQRLPPGRRRERIELLGVGAGQGGVAFPSLGPFAGQVGALQPQAGRADRALQGRPAGLAARYLLGLEGGVLLELAGDRLLQRQAGELEHRARGDQAGRDPRPHLEKGVRCLI
jgi:hypothetical protein